VPFLPYCAGVVKAPGIVWDGKRSLASGKSDGYLK